jgi:adenylate cyclase
MHEPPRILIVDDNDANRDILQTRLSEHGYELLQAADGEEALAIAKECQPDLILLDIMMPNMDGVEVSRRLRADPATASIPIVVMSAHSRMRAIGDTMAADDRLPKPFELGDLYATVARWTTAP